MIIRRNKVIFILSTILIIVACKTENKADKPIPKEVPVIGENIQSPEDQLGKELLEKCLIAHGGLERWNSFKGLEYQLNDNGKKVYQITQLKDRRAYLKSKNYEVGFDGEVAWAKPDATQVSGASSAFYYNLDFYFVAIPFVLADKGVSVTHIGQQELKGKMYEVLKITFGSGIGFTPEDVYKMYIDPESHILGVLTYSVAYFDRENAAIKSAKVYSGWKDVQGILMPEKMENFELNDGKIGKSKNHLRIFEDFKFLKEIPNEDIFNVPQGAIIEALAGN